MIDVELEVIQPYILTDRLFSQKLDRHLGIIRRTDIQFHPTAEVVVGVDMTYPVDVNPSI